MKIEVEKEIIVKGYIKKVENLGYELKKHIADWSAWNDGIASLLKIRDIAVNLTELLRDCERLEKSPKERFWLELNNDGDGK